MDNRKVMQGLLVRIAMCVTGLLTFAILLLGLFNDNGYFAVRKQRQKLAALNAENAAMTAEIEKLREENELLKYDPYTIEKIAREEQKMGRPGEIIFEFRPPANH